MSYLKFFVEISVHRIIFSTLFEVHPSVQRQSTIFTLLLKLCHMRPWQISFDLSGRFPFVFSYPLRQRSLETLSCLYSQNFSQFDHSPIFTSQNICLRLGTVSISGVVLLYQTSAMKLLLILTVYCCWTFWSQIIFRLCQLFASLLLTPRWPSPIPYDVISSQHSGTKFNSSRLKLSSS